MKRSTSAAGTCTGARSRSAGKDGGQGRRNRRDVQVAHVPATPVRAARPPGQRRAVGDADGLPRHRLAGAGEDGARHVDSAAHGPDVEPGGDRIVDQAPAHRPPRRDERQAAVAELAQQVPHPAAVDLGEVEPGRRLQVLPVAARQGQQLDEQTALAARRGQVTLMGVPDHAPRGAGRSPAPGRARHDRPGAQQGRPVRVARDELELERGLHERAPDPGGRHVAVGVRGAVGVGAAARRGHASSRPLPPSLCPLYAPTGPTLGEGGDRGSGRAAGGRAGGVTQRPALALRTRCARAGGISGSVGSCTPGAELRTARERTARHG